MIRSLKVALASLLVIVPLLALAGEPSTSRSTTTTATYKAGSVEAHQIQQWLAEHAPYRPGSRVGDPMLLKGDIQVRIVTTQTGVRPQEPGDGPPVPLPPNGNPGDTISITHNSGGWTQTWEYQWTGGVWVLVRYSYFRTRPA